MARPLPIDLFSIKGKTAICTGATGTIGSELCLALAEAGANIVSIQLEDDPLGDNLKSRVERFGRDFHAFHCNIGDSDALRAVFQEIWAQGIVPDILLNGAAMNRHGTVEEFDDEIIDQIISVNLKGAYVAAQEFSSQLLKLNRPGKIINIGSVTCYVGMVHTSVYASTKGGLLQMTKAFSNELAIKGIQVNCICPGYFKTPLTADLESDPVYNSMIIGRTPAGRWGEPRDLRGTVIFLASPASDFVTGTSLVVDGGLLGK